jgi:DNA mismatch repair protein MutS2
MNIYPSSLVQQLDLDQVLSWLEESAFSKKAKNLCKAIKPSKQVYEIQEWLLQTNEYLLSMHQGDVIPHNQYPELDKELQLLLIENSSLKTVQFVAIRTLLSMTRELVQFFNEKEAVFPTLTKKMNTLTYFPEIEKNISEIINKEGIVKDDASPNLTLLRKALAENRKNTDRQYRLLITKLKKQGWLAEFEESYINGRRVLSVLAEHKRSVKGITHSQSESGKITFIEPMALVTLNNDRINLEEEEKNEIIKILKVLTELIQPYHSTINFYYNTLIFFDVVHAKATLALRMNATMPQLCTSASTLKLINAYHPTLYIHNKLLGLNTVPISCEFNDTNRIMVISGPNAGGKSITLKTIGLLQMMLQSGLLIPCSAKSEMCIVESIFGDIGDHQSIEDGLSTYSSRLLKMKYFLEKATPTSLILIDEFGTGSDPDMGGAMAEVILDELNAKKVKGVVTTHFTNLKILANTKEGIFNASMLFHIKTLKPLYQLTIGEPGSSFTFEVAEKIGLPAEIIQRSKEKLSTEKVLMDGLLNQLQEEKNKVAKLRKDLQKQIGKTTSEKRTFQDLNIQLDDKLLKINENKEEKAKLIEYGKRLYNLTQEWEQTKNKKGVIQKFVKLVDTESEKKKAQLLYEQTSEVIAKKVEIVKETIAIGSNVKIHKGKEIGIVKELFKKRAKVLFGHLLMNIGLEQLVVLENNS